MTFLNLSLGSPVVRASETVTGSSASWARGSSWPGSPRRGGSRSWSIRSSPEAWPHRCTSTGGRTSSPSCSMGAGGSGWARRSSGDLVFKPRDVWHTFWNATDRPARLLEIISPAGFEQLFVELAELLRTDPDSVAANAALGAKYGVESDPQATAQVVAEHGLIERPA